MKNLILSSLMTVLFLSFALAIPVFATPIQTKQGCQTEAADYLVDVRVARALARAKFSQI